jgi:uncharacterized transporter YbjL
MPSAKEMALWFIPLGICICMFPMLLLWGIVASTFAWDNKIVSGFFISYLMSTPICAGWMIIQSLRRKEKTKLARRAAFYSGILALILFLAMWILPRINSPVLSNSRQSRYSKSAE